MALISILITSLLLISTVMSVAYNENPLLNRICTETSKNYSEGSNYAANLKNLLTDLYKYAPTNHGFGNISLGHDHDRVYGLAQCRGDVSTDDCEDCLYDARCKITRRCYKRQGIIWYDNCLVKYSDGDFFGKIDTKNIFVLRNVKNVTSDNAKRFNATAIGLLSDLSKNATKTTTANKNLLYFARGQVLFDKVENVTIYGMVQCTGDLSTEKCRECLNNAVRNLPIYKATFNSVGQRFVSASCNVRYEVYAFLKDPAPN